MKIIILNNIICCCFYGLFFLVPLFMTPVNYELFEFNKMVLVYFLTIIIAGAWAAKWIVNQKIEFYRTPIDIPIFIFLTSQILSTVFSINPHTSIWGYYSRFNGGLLSTICYILLYYAFINNITIIQNSKIKNQNENLKFKNFHSAIFNQRLTINCLFFLLASGLLVTLYGIAEHFGIDAGYWVQNVRNRVFSTFGQPNWLGAWIDGIIPTPLAFILTNTSLYLNLSLFKQHNSKLKFKVQNYFFYFLFFTFYLCLLFTGSRSAYLGFIAFLIVFSIFILIKRRNLLKKIILFYLMIILVSFIVGTPFNPSFSNLIKGRPVNPQPDYNRHAPLAETISSSMDIRKVVWTGALRVWRNWPIFGSGVETFGYSYYNFRPVEHNNLSEWDFLYNKAHNEYLNYLATTGIVGLGAYLLMIGWFLVWNFKKFKSQKSICQSADKITNQNSKFLILNCHFDICTLHFALLAGYASILVTNFFGFSVVPVALLFWLYPAIIFSLDPPCFKQMVIKQSTSKTIKQRKVINYFFFFFLLLLTFYLLIFTLKYWLADYYYNSGRKFTASGYLLAGYQQLVKAVKMNPSEPLFKIDLGKIAAMIALSYHNEKAADSAKITEQFAKVAKQETNLGLKLNPYHLNYLKTASQTYLYLSPIDAENLSVALNLMLQAQKLSPTDPKITLNLASLYQQLNDNQTALKYLEKTVALKSNYIPGQLSLAKTYYKLGEKEKAINQLKFLLEKVDNKNKEGQQLLKEWQ
jgi:putative inorganic carbon (HCO3(-)) transporter